MYPSKFYKMPNDPGGNGIIGLICEIAGQSTKMNIHRLAAVDPTDSLPPALRDSFHEGVRSGDIESLLQMLEQEPLLSRARTRERKAPLFLASVHPDAHKAVQMIDLLMEKGAVLGSRDRQGRNVLLYACHHGVEWIVVECLLKWNASKGGKVLKWSCCEENGNSSLLLACLGGHTQLALRLLDEIDIAAYAAQSHPFRVLEVVIELGNEAHALAIAEHPQIQTVVKAGNTYVKYVCKGYGGILDKSTLQSCVTVAVRQEMADVLRLMDKLKHPEVCKATWCSTFGLIAEQEKALLKPTNPVILGIAHRFAKDQRWEQVKGLFLLRYRGQDVGVVHGELRVDLLALLPDQLFRLVVEFIKPRTIHRVDEKAAFDEFMEMLWSDPWEVEEVGSSALQ